MEQTTSTQRSISVVGTGRAKVTPDVVRLDLRVGHDASDVAAALAGASHAIEAVGAAVRERGVSDADIVTLDAQVQQRWDNNGNAVGFTAQQRLAVVVRDVDVVGAVLDSAARAAGNALLVDQVRLDVADRAPGLAQAREAAFADARAKAEQYAALAGAQLGPVLVVAEGDLPGSRGRPERAMALGARDRMAGMPVETGDLDLAAGVTVMWALD